MEQITQLMKELNIAQLAAIGVMFWFFYSRLNAKIEKVESNLEKVESHLAGKIDRLDEKVNSLDKRLVAVETLLHMKDCCMLKDDRQSKKVD